MADDEVAVPVEIADTFEAYLTAKLARARWAEEEKALKDKILLFFGYDDEDPKPQPVTATSPNGVPLFRVSVGSWKGLDFNHLRDHYPDVYAACERTKPTKAIKPAG